MGAELVHRSRPRRLRLQNLRLGLLCPMRGAEVGNLRRRQESRFIVCFLALINQWEVQTSRDIQRTHRGMFFKVVLGALIDPAMGKGEAGGSHSTQNGHADGIGGQDVHESVVPSREDGRMCRTDCPT